MNGIECLNKGKCHTSPGFKNVNVGHGQLEAGKARNVRCVPLTSLWPLFVGNVLSVMCVIVLLFDVKIFSPNKF